MKEELEFSVNEAWTEHTKENSWVAFVPQYAENSDGQKFMRPKGRSIIYKLVKEDGDKENYECNDCGSAIMSATVAHPIHDGPFPGSGSGKCHYEGAPYCPKCEEKPSYSGSPISIGPKVR